jgi:N-acetylmuramoyl-L-alanine amidase
MSELVRIQCPNYWPGRYGFNPYAIVLHTMAGSLAGCDSHFQDMAPESNPDNAVSAHFGVGLNGEIHQYVNTEDSAWANGRPDPGTLWNGPPGISPNILTISIETEDMADPSTPVTQAQYESVLDICKAQMLKFGGSILYLISHRAISPISKPNCPGRRWIESGKFVQLATDTGLVAVP